MSRGRDKHRAGAGASGGRGGKTGQEQVQGKRSRRRNRRGGGARAVAGHEQVRTIKAEHEQEVWRQERRRWRRSKRRAGAAARQKKDRSWTGVKAGAGEEAGCQLRLCACWALLRLR